MKQQRQDLDSGNLAPEPVISHQALPLLQPAVFWAFSEWWHMAQKPLEAPGLGWAPLPVGLEDPSVTTVCFSCFDHCLFFDKTRILWVFANFSSSLTFFFSSTDKSNVFPLEEQGKKSHSELILCWFCCPLAFTEGTASTQSSESRWGQKGFLLSVE